MAYFVVCDIETRALFPFGRINIGLEFFILTSISVNLKDFTFRALIAASFAQNLAAKCGYGFDLLRQYSISSLVNIFM